MRFFHLKRPRNYQSKSMRYPLYAMALLSLVLAVALAVTLIMKNDDTRMANLGREQLKSSIQSDLTMVLRTYDQLNLPRADIQGELLPDIREHLYTAYAMNNVLSSVYGKGESILDNEFYTQITLAVDEIERQINMGQIVDIPASSLTSCMLKMKDELARAFGEDSLMPQTALN